ncbi:Hypothetical protein, putative [Bodo saltans]|uniref:Importin N-terminal domain-containing protein n=1 Tax=Bodo saltans TaxID=75058 RepID=A0A0S4J2Q3_BODSA|nr:Hypothetical protein, putative [Bodo saltans]|eukprot:CUG62815.1 Hypothetical protein, putative [Bodo saltans]
MAEEGLPMLLGALASADNVERKRAEAALEEFLGRQGFFPTLLQRLRGGQLSSSQQLTGIAILKNMQHRMPEQDSLATLTELSQVLEHDLQNQQQHRAVVPLWVSASAKLMCRVMSNDLETVAPVQQLLFRLLSNTSTVHIGVTCCRELTVELPQEVQIQFFEPFLPALVSIALPETLVQSPPGSTFSALTSSSLHVLAEIMEQQRGSGSRDAMTLFPGATMNTCLFVSSFSLSEENDIHNQSVVEGLRLLLHMLDASHAAVLQSEKFFQAILEAIEVDVETMRSASSESYTTIQRAMALRWETLARVLKRKKSATAVVKLFRGMLEPVLRLVLETCMLPDLVLSSWDEDANAFLKMEGERRDEISWTPRDVAVDCAELMLKRFGGVWMGVVLRVGAEILATSIDGSEEIWRRREAFLFILGYFLEKSDLATLEKLGASGFTSSLVPAVLGVDLAGGAPLALSARALVLLEIILKRDTNGKNRHELCSQVLMPCIYTLDGPLTMVTAVAVTLLRRVLKYLGTSSLESPLGGGVGERALSSLLRCLTSPDLSDDVLYTFVDTSLAILRQGSALGISQAGWAATVPQLMAVWKAHLRDPNMGEMITDALALVIRNQCADDMIAAELGWLRDVLCGYLALVIRNQCADDMIAAELGWLRDVLCGYGSIEMLCIIPYVVRFIKVVMQHASMELVNTSAAALLEPLCQLLLTNDDSSIAVGAADCLGAVLYRAAGGLHHMTVVVTRSLVYIGEESEIGSAFDSPIPSSEWMATRPPTPPLSDVLIAIVVSLLREDRSEISLLNVGAYLGAVASCVSAFTEQQINRFLKTVIRRLIVDPVQSKTATGQLLLPFAILLKTHPTALVSALVRLDCLGPVLEKWVCMLPVLADDAAGVSTLARSLDALLNVLDKNSEVDGATLATLQACIVMWYDGRRKDQQRGTPLPFPLAAFVAVAKVACVVITRPLEFSSEVGEDFDNATNDSDSGDDGDDEECEDDDDDDAEEEEGVETPTTQRQRASGTSTKTPLVTSIPSTFATVLQRMVIIAPEYYTPSIQGCFSSAEGETLSWFASTMS